MPGLTCSIFGASGAIGQLLLQQALERGHRVRAHCRTSSPWTPPPSVTIVRGPIDDPTFLQALVDGSDAVFCLIGSRPPHRDVFCASATRSIVDAMVSRHIDRLICLTGAMIAPDPRRLTFPARAMAALFRLSRPLIAADRAAQEAVVAESGLSWTVFKPPRLTDGRSTGHLSAGTALRVGLRSFVPRAELAAYMITAAERSRHLRQRVYLKCDA